MAVSSVWLTRMRTNAVARSVPVVAVFVVVLLVTSFLVPSFLTTANIPNVLQQMSITGIVAVGMTFVILTGGIDLSVGSILAVTTVLFSTVLSHNASAPV